MSILTRLLTIATLVLAVPAAAQSVTIVEEWIEAVPAGASRYVSPQHEQAERKALAAYGPFRVLSPTTAALVGITDSRSLAQFRAMLAAHPHIATLEFVEAPGTHDDVANLAIGRMIRQRGMATVVADGGSVRSGAVELFLSGVSRSIAPEAEFAVHGWLDDWGRGAEDYPATAPEHRRYLQYYAEMGMDKAQAAAFYAMTNSVPFEDALWLTGSEMIGWLGESQIARSEGDHQAVSQPQPQAEPQAESRAARQPAPQAEREAAPQAEPQSEPRLAYLDLGLLFP